MKMTIADMMKKRSPLARREAVAPVDLYQAPPVIEKRVVKKPEVLKPKGGQVKAQQRRVVERGIVDGRLLLSIGKIAKRTGETHRAIRFWTEEGLLQTAGLTKGRHYRFTSDTIKRVEKIRHLQETKRLTIAELRKVFHGK